MVGYEDDEAGRFIKNQIKTKFHLENNIMNFSKTIATFSVGDYIGFKVFNTTTCYMDYYIGRIIKITDNNLVLQEVKINRESISIEIEVPFDAIIPNSYNYVHRNHRFRNKKDRR